MTLLAGLAAGYAIGNDLRVTYSAHRRKSSVTLPGFADLGAIRYSGCRGQ